MDMDLAASIQKVIEEIIVKLAKDIAKQTGEKNLCLAGGVALNALQMEFFKRNIFENIWIQPAAGDAGGALGAALAAWHIHYNKDRNINKNLDAMQGSYLGPEFTNDEIYRDLEQCGAKFNLFLNLKL